MIEQPEVVYIQPPESVRFLTTLPSTSAQYLLYSTTGAVPPGSFDQVLKNNVLPVGSAPSVEFQPYAASSEG